MRANVLLLDSFLCKSKLIIFLRYFELALALNKCDELTYFKLEKKTSMEVRHMRSPGLESAIWSRPHVSIIIIIEIHIAVFHSECSELFPIPSFVNWWSLQLHISVAGLGPRDTCVARHTRPLSRSGDSVTVNGFAKSPEGPITSVTMCVNCFVYNPLLRAAAS